jgi:hypothetical protein
MSLLALQVRRDSNKFDPDFEDLPALAEDSDDSDDDGDATPYVSITKHHIKTSLTSNVMSSSAT